MHPSNLFKIFARSPIKPLQKHMAMGHACAETLMAFFAAVLKHDWIKATLEQERIVEIEHTADKIKQDIRLHMPKNLFLPIPREDVLEILSLQDKIPNKIKDIAGIVLGRHMHIPVEISADYLDLLRRSIDAAEQAHHAINEIDELLETGYSDKEVALIAELINKLSQIEHETDEIQIKVRQGLFHIEASLSPVDVIFLYKVIEWTGDIADLSEKVGHRLQLLLAH